MENPVAIPGKRLKALGHCLSRPVAEGRDAASPTVILYFPVPIKEQGAKVATGHEKMKLSAKTVSTTQR